MPPSALSEPLSRVPFQVSVSVNLGDLDDLNNLNDLIESLLGCFNAIRICLHVFRGFSLEGVQVLDV